MKKKFNLKLLTKINLILIFLIIIVLIYLIYLKYIKKYMREKFIPDKDADILFYTYGTDYDDINTLIKSCKENNVNINVDGIGSKWNGNKDKPTNFINFLNECRDDQIVMFVDANDVIFYDNPENIKKKFLEFNKNIVVSTEKYCAPDQELIEYYPEETKNETFRYVNSGGYMGYAKDLKEMLKTYNEGKNCIKYNQKDNTIPDGFISDQRCMHKYYLENLDKIALDHKHKIWSCVVGQNRDDYEIQQYNKLYNKVTNEHSSILHTAGYEDWHKSLYINTYAK
jgi:hypothetical protein